MTVHVVLLIAVGILFTLMFMAMVKIVDIKERLETHSQLLNIQSKRIDNKLSPYDVYSWCKAESSNADPILTARKLSALEKYLNIELINSPSGYVKKSKVSK